RDPAAKATTQKAVAKERRVIAMPPELREVYHRKNDTTLKSLRPNVTLVFRSLNSTAALPEWWGGQFWPQPAIEPACSVTRKRFRCRRGRLKVAPTPLKGMTGPRAE